jgi:PAS domain S-box-containing protein
MTEMRTGLFKSKEVIRVWVVIISLLVFFSGILIVVGWRYNIEFFKTYGLGNVPAKAMAGFCIVLAGISLLLVQFRSRFNRILSGILSSIVFLISFITIIEIVFKADFGIDDILIRKQVIAGIVTGPQRMALNAAICMVLVAASLIQLSFRKVRYVFLLEFCVVFAFAIGSLGFVGFIFGLSDFSIATGYTNMAVVASLFIISLCAGVYLSYISITDEPVTTDQKLFAGIVYVAAIILLVTLLSSSGINDLREANSWVDHTQTTKDKLNRLSADVVDIQTSMRGFFISEKLEYLEPLNRAKSDLPVLIDELSLLLSDNKRQLVRLDTLNRLISERVKNAELINSKVLSGDKEEATRIFQTGIGKNLTDSIRSLIERMKLEENTLLKLRNETQLRHTQMVHRLVFLNMFLMIMLITAMVIIIQRGIAQRRKLIEIIRTDNEELEKKVEERAASLAKSEERFRTTLENMMEGCQIIGYDWKYIYLNRTAEFHNLRSNKELLGNRYMDMWPGIEQTQVFRNIKCCMDERVPLHFENEFEYPDGEKKWFDLSVQPVPEGVFILSFDITKRKTSEAAIEESEAKFRLITENSADAIFITDVNGNYVYCNKAVTDLLGYSTDEILKMNIGDIAPEGSKDSHYGEFKKLLSTGKLWTELDLLKKDGSVVDTDINSIILPGGLIYGSCRDITEKKKERSELLKYRNHLEELVAERTEEVNRYMNETRDLYEYAPCGYHSVNSNGVFVRMNNTELDWLGYKKEEIVGKMKFIDLIHPRDKERFSINFAQFINDRNIRNLEFELLRKDGTTFFASISGTAILDQNGNFLMSRSSVFDITERRAAEEEIKRAWRVAEDANRAKSEFLANMSHEIRTPMNAVLGYTELLGSKLTDPVQKDYIESIKSSGKSLLTLINDILDLSKIEAGKLELEFEYVQTDSFFSEFEKIFAFKIRENGIKFILDIESGTPSGLNIDEARVRQIVFNLIGNAIKFTSTGQIVLKVYCENPKIVRFTPRKSEELIDLVIEVQDTGIGISKDLQDAVFEPFVQLKDYKQFGGTGLGLTITKKLASLMNGSISLKSEPGKGSTFIVRIPEILYKRDYKDENQELVIDPTRIIFEEAVIQIVDDVKHNRSFIRDALKDTKFRILESEDGLDGYRVAEENVPDLIIADIRMPVVDGFQFLEMLKANKNLENIPVIAYSASVLKDQRERIYHSKFAGLLIKPIKIAELYMELMNHLPYKLTEDDFADVFSKQNTVSAEVVDLSGLINLLENELYETWRTFAVKQPIGEVREFGNRLQKTGLEHSSAMIKSYGEELIQAADSFNIESILNLLGKYTTMIQLLKEPKNKAHE